MSGLSVEPKIASRPVVTSKLMLLAAWSTAAVVLGLLAVSVVRHLRAPATTMSMALYRQGAAPSGPLMGSNLVTAWHLDVAAVGFLTLLATLYLTGMVMALRRGTRWPLARAASFFAGLAVIAYATCGGIAVYDMALFSAHMIGHLLLIMIAPAFLVSGRPLRLAITASRPKTGRRLQAVLRSRPIALLTSPPVTLATYAVVIVGTHLTGFMNTVMRNAAFGQLEHLMYLVAGFQFFLLILGDEPIRWQLGIPLRWLFLALAMAVDTFTGIVLLQQSYPMAMMRAPGLHVDALDDTHTGGAIMWVGGDGIMVLFMVALVVMWLRLSERDRRGTLSWLEEARRAHFASHAVAAPSDPESDLDEDDEQWAAYNAYLQSINGPRR